jgi:hypothetical protein
MLMARAVSLAHRHGHRSRSLLGTFGRVEIAVPRARHDTAAGRIILVSSIRYGPALVPAGRPRHFHPHAPSQWQRNMSAARRDSRSRDLARAGRLGNGSWGGKPVLRARRSRKRRLFSHRGQAACAH